MILPLLLAVVAFAALLPVLLPLLRGAPGMVERGQYDRAVYRDQLRELDRDVARGVLSEDEAHGARLEIQRRLLAVDAQPIGPARLARSPVLAVAVAAIVAGGSIGVYLILGAPSVPDQPYASRKPAASPQMAGEHIDLQQAAARLQEKLRSDPANPEGWLLYARTTSMLSQWDIAADAYRRAIVLGAKGPAVQAGYGEMLVMQAQGIVTPAAHEAFAAVLKDDPKNDVARYYLALGAGQAGEVQQAIDQLQGLLADIPDDSPMRTEIGRRIGEAAKAAGLPIPVLAKGTPAAAQRGPDAAAVQAAANMPEADRKAMIAGMVARLAAHLETEPGDLAGWMQLGRAYVVLGERDKSAEAYDKAAALKPGDTSIPLQAVESMLEGLQPSDPLPPRAVALLRQVEVAAPDEPEVLWYLGIVAARDAHPADARRYWGRLLVKLPSDGEDAKMVKAAMDALKGG